MNINDNINYWTVGKLIEELKKYPKDIKVCVEAFMMNLDMPINKIDAKPHCIVLKQSLRKNK